MVFKEIIMKKEQLIKLRELLKTKLSVGVTEIIFEKADGTIRVINATRDDDYIPMENVSTYTSRAESDCMIPVWDTVNNGWRGFSIDSVISVNGVKFEHLVKLTEK